MLVLIMITLAGTILILYILGLVYASTQAEKEPEDKPEVQPLSINLFISISSNTVSNNTVSDNTVSVDYKDAQILLRIAEAEAGNCSIEERAYIMATVLNRVSDPRFPDTVEGVVFAKSQFTPVSTGSYYKVEISKETHLALAEIEEGKYRDFEGLYFENCKGSSWQSRNLTRVETADTKNRFYK